MVFCTQEVALQAAPDQLNAGISQEGLAVWLKADEGVAVSEDTHSVESWENQADGEILSLVNNSMPGIMEGTDADYSYLQFDGTNALKGTTVDLNDRQEITLILVGQYEGEDPARDSYADINTALFWGESAGWGSMSLAPYHEQVMMRFGIGDEQGVSRINRKDPGGLSINTAIKNGGTHSLSINGNEVLIESGKRKRPRASRQICMSAWVYPRIRTAISRGR